MSDQWYYLKEGFADDETVGPITGAQLLQLAVNGDIKANTKVAMDGTAWAPASSVPKLHEAIERREQQIRQQKEAAKQQKQAEKEQKRQEATQRREQKAAQREVNQQHREQQSQANRQAKAQRDAERLARTDRPVCASCGIVGNVRKKTQGSLAIEIALYVLFCAPGIIYTLWRMTSKKRVCGSCGSANIVSSLSPVGQQIVNGQR